MTKILFQGDSITDCGRSRENDRYLGNGYASLVKARLNYDYPGSYEFANRAVSGNRITDLYARIKRDIINVKPDILSIHIGINDVWHEVSANDGVCAEKFEKIYDMLLCEIKEALPDIKIMLLGAFVTKNSATEPTWDTFQSETLKRAAIAKKLCEKHGAIYVDLQSKFDEAVSKEAEPYWTAEGVHPLEAGHELITRAWLSAFQTYFLERK